MRKSFTYYITLLVLKLKGLKREFSKDPIDFKKIRKEDVHYPKGRFFRQKNVSTFNVSNSLITEIKQTQNSNKLLLFIHGGAFISGPAKHHWDSIKELFKRTNHNIWMCNYPKAPEHNILEISKNIDAVYNMALTKYEARDITIIGDSVGGTLTTALVQRLKIKNEALPNKIILISPVMDASLCNPEVEKLELKDPMLSKAGILSAKKMCAQNTDLKNEIISPLYGSFNNFPETALFLAENDISYPDQLLTVEKLNNAKVTTEVFIGKNMPHIWPLLPVMKEAKMALKDLIKILIR